MCTTISAAGRVVVCESKCREETDCDGGVLYIAHRRNRSREAHHHHVSSPCGCIFPVPDIFSGALGRLACITRRPRTVECEAISHGAMLPSALHESTAVTAEKVGRLQCVLDPCHTG
jgi:hypothetical protein